MNKYLEIVVVKTEKVSKRFNLTGKTKERVNKIYNDKIAKLTNSNFMRIIDSEEKLESIEIKEPKQIKE